MDQNLLTLLLGSAMSGVVGIVSALITNYFIHRQANRSEKIKEIRQVIDEIYKITIDIDRCYLLETQGWDIEEHNKNLVLFNDSILGIQRLVNLNVQALSKETKTYLIKQSIDLIKEYHNKKFTEIEYHDAICLIFDEGAKYRKTLADYLVKKGYSDK